MFYNIWCISFIKPFAYPSNSWVYLLSSWVELKTLFRGKPNLRYSKSLMRDFQIIKTYSFSCYFIIRTMSPRRSARRNATPPPPPQYDPNIVQSAIAAAVTAALSQANFSGTARTGNNQLTNATPFLRLDTATLQATVIATVAAIIAYNNSVNSSREGNDIKNPNQRNNRSHLPVATYKNTARCEHKNMKRKPWSKRGGKSTQRNAKKQSTNHTPTPKRSYNGNQPKCNRCNFHHHGPCRERYYAMRNRMGHTVRYYKGPIQPPALTMNVGVDDTCYECGATGHSRRDYPRANNRNADGRGRVFAKGQEEAVADPTVVTGTFPLDNSYACILVIIGA